MLNISDFLGKFLKDITATEFQKKTIINIIQKHTGLDIQSDLEIKNNTLYINLSPIIKNKIFIHKQSILEEINKNITSKITDIK